MRNLQRMNRGLLKYLAAFSIIASFLFAPVTNAFASAPAVVLSVSAPAAGRYSASELLTFTVVFDVPVTVAGVPQLQLSFDQGGDRFAEYVTGTGTDSLTFRYRVEAGVADSNGIGLASSIRLNGGTINDASGSAALLALNGVSDLTLVRVGGLIAYEPFQTSSGSQVDLTGSAGSLSRGFTGSWKLVPTNGSASRIATSVKLGPSSGSTSKFPTNSSFTLPSGDGKAQSLGGWSPSNSARQLVNPISLDKNGIVYMSFLFRDTDAGRDGQSMLGFLTGLPSNTIDYSQKAITFGYAYSAAGANRGQLGIDYGNANHMAFCSDNSTTTCSSGNAYTAVTNVSGGISGMANGSSETWFMVAEITTAVSGNDTIRIKKYAPTDSLPSNPPSTWDLTLSTALTGNLNYASVQLESASQSELDEMRIASSYADVVGLTPPPPTNVQASLAGDGASASVTFTPPTGAGASSVTGYLVTAVPLAGGSAISVTSNSSPASISGLRNGISYSFSVASVNASGIGEAASATPGQPGTPSAISGNASATVTVTPPSSGGTTNFYIVTSSPGAQSCSVSASSSPLSCTISGLSNGTSYSFTVVSSGPGGTSANSATSNSVTPASSPPVTYSVTFDSQNGSAVPTSSYQAGGSIALPAAPIRSSYNFLGWFAQSSGGNALASPYSPASAGNLILYARWQAPISYVVSFDTHGGSAVGDTSFSSGGSIALPSQPTRSGFQFDGWFLNASGGNLISWPYAPGVTNDITLHAQWSANPAQTVSWAPQLSHVTSASPITPSVVATSSGSGTISYAIVDPRTTGCSINSVTGVLTFDRIGECTVRASASATSSEASGSREVTFSITSTSTQALIQMDATVGNSVGNSQVDFAASGLQTGSSWDLILRSTPQTLASGTAQVGNIVVGGVNLPANLPSGWHSITFSGTGISGNFISHAVWFEVNQSGNLMQVSSSAPTQAQLTQSALANTGAQIQNSLWLFLLLVISGAALMFVRNKFGNSPKQ